VNGGAHLYADGTAFDITLFVPADVVQLLSAAGGGSDNLRFRDINVTGGVSMGSVLDLELIGLETTANLRYLFPGNFSVATEATLTIGSGVRAEVETNQTLTINGMANLQPSSTLTLLATYSSQTSRVVVAGTLTASGATFARAGQGTSTLTVNGGGHLYADGCGFDVTLYVPADVVPLLSAAGGGSDNLRFRDINITGSLPTHASLDLELIGLETTANLRFLFPANFTVAVGATLTVGPGVRVEVETNQTLTINGMARLQPSSTLTLLATYSSQTSRVVVAGTLTASGATFARAGQGTSTLTVSAGGHLFADGCAFDVTLSVPPDVVPLLSAAGGGSDNVRFRDINITGPLPAGTSLDLELIGTQTTDNLRYLFPASFTVPAQSTLTIAAQVNVVAVAAFTNAGSVSVAGTLRLNAGGTTSGDFSVGYGGIVTVIGSLTMSGGTLVLLDGSELSTTRGLSLTGGVLSGLGRIDGNVSNAATIRVGDATTTGTLAIFGNYTQAGTGTLVVKITGPAGNPFDQLAVSGSAVLGGTLTVMLTGDQPASGDAFRVLTCGSQSGSLTGSFATLGGDGPLFTDGYDPNAVTLTAL
jgi:hypothetical protein